MIALLPKSTKSSPSNVLTSPLCPLGAALEASPASPTGWWALSPALSLSKGVPSDAAIGFLSAVPVAGPFVAPSEPSVRGTSCGTSPSISCGSTSATYLQDNVHFSNMYTSRHVHLTRSSCHIEALRRMCTMPTMLHSIPASDVDSSQLFAVFRENGLSAHYHLTTLFRVHCSFGTGPPSKKSPSHTSICPPPPPPALPPLPPFPPPNHNALPAPAKPPPPPPPRLHSVLQI